MSGLFCWIHMLRTGPRYRLPTEHSSVFMSNTGSWRSLRLPNLDSSALGRETHISIRLCQALSLPHSLHYRTVSIVFIHFLPPTWTLPLCHSQAAFLCPCLLLGYVLLCRDKNLVFRGSVPWKSMEQWCPLFPLSRKLASQLFLRVRLNLCLVFHGGFLSHTTLCLNPCLKCPVPMFEMLSPCSMFTREPDSLLSQASHSYWS